MSWLVYCLFGFLVGISLVLLLLPRPRRGRLYLSPPREAKLKRIAGYAAYYKQFGVPLVTGLNQEEIELLYGKDISAQYPERAVKVML